MAKYQLKINGKDIQHPCGKLVVNGETIIVPEQEESQIVISFGKSGLTIEADKVKKGEKDA